MYHDPANKHMFMRPIDFWPSSDLKGLIGLLAPSHLNMSPSSQFYTHFGANVNTFD